MTPWTAARQALLSMGFPRQEHWSGLPVPSPGDLPEPGIEPASLALAGSFFTTEPPEHSDWASASCCVQSRRAPLAPQKQTWGSPVARLLSLLAYTVLLPYVKERRFLRGLECCCLSISRQMALYSGFQNSAGVRISSEFPLLVPELWQLSPDCSDCLTLHSQPRMILARSSWELSV